jgi:hypothetical protein
MQHRTIGRSVVRGAVAAVMLAMAACIPDPAAPPPPGLTGPPYLAIVTRVDAPTGVSGGTRYAFRITGISSGQVVDTTVLVSPGDTSIISVLPADYLVTLSTGVPDYCAPRGGLQQSVFIPEGSNTGLVRYTIICRPVVELRVSTDGSTRDDAYIARLTGGGNERLRTLQAQDTVLVDDLPAGSYLLELLNVASSCVVTSAGGAAFRITIPDRGGALVELRVSCNDPGRTPVILGVTSRVLDGVNGVTIRYVDPQRDVNKLLWDLTDCRGTSLTGSFRERRNLAFSRLAAADTALLITIFDTDRSVGDLAGACTAVRVVDAEGNSSQLAEAPIRGTTEGAPIATSFDARLFDRTIAVLNLNVAAPAGVFVGFVPTLSIRDGALGPFDGKNETLIIDPVGVTGTVMPQFDLPSLLSPFDVLSYDLYLFNDAGDFRKASDAQLFF